MLLVKAALGALLALTLGCASGPAPMVLRAAPQALTYQEGLLQAARAAAVVLRSTGGGGSGVCVYQDHRVALVLTAAHVIEGDEGITVGIETGKVYPAKVLYADDAADLAVLEVPPVFSAVARLVVANEGHRFLPVLAYGFPALVGPDGHPTFGLVASERDEDEVCITDHNTPDPLAPLEDPGVRPCVKVKRLSWRITAPIFFGNSGGAVYVNDGAGWALAGVAQRVVVSPWGAVATHIGFSSTPMATKSAINAARYVREEALRGGK